MVTQNEPDASDVPDGTTLVETLLANCQRLLAELEEFRDFAEQRKLFRYNPVEIGQLKTTVGTELKSLQKLSESDLTAEKTVHTLHSSNLPYYAAIWDAAKGSRCLTAIHRRYYWGKRPTRESKKAAGPNQAAEKRCALVDVVGQDGEEWIKVSTISEDRLKFEIAKAEWEAGDSSSEEENEYEEQSTDKVNRLGADTVENELDRIELVKIADALQRAATANRIHYKTPKVRFVLPKISPDPPVELHPIIACIKSTGASVDLGPQLKFSSNLSAEVFPNLMPSAHPPLTKTLNIDCSILLALVSDLSHTPNHPILADYKLAIKQQIEFEAKEHSVPSVLWPSMAGRDLLCTQEAAKTMKTIVESIGTDTERKRTEVMLADNAAEYDEAKGKTLRAAFAEFSEYDVPEDWRLPIRIVNAPVSDSDIQAAVSAGDLPPVSMQIAEQLTTINRSVFIYGWMQRITTVSSNRGVAKQIESTIEKDDQGAMGPEVWIREPARSLVGKEKERRK